MVFRDVPGRFARSAMRCMTLVLLCVFCIHLVSSKKNKIKRIEEEEEDLEVDEDNDDDDDETSEAERLKILQLIGQELYRGGPGFDTAIQEVFLPPIKEDLQEHSKVKPSSGQPKASRRQGFNVRSWSIRPAVMPPSPVLLVPHALPMPAPVFVNRPMMLPTINGSVLGKQHSLPSMNPAPSHPGESIQKPNTIPTLPLNTVMSSALSPPTRFSEGRSISHSITTTTSGSTSTSALADDIRCEKRVGENYLSAHLIPPPGYSATPYIPLKPDLDVSTSTKCSIVLQGMSYMMEFRDFSSCGVISRREPDGKEWLTVSVLFPLVNGLKTPDDEVVTIKCKPHDRSATANYAVDYHGNLVSRQAQSRSSVFQNREQELQCELGLYRRAGPSSGFSNRLDTGSAIELGQELQLRASIRSGDGWNFAKISDIVVQRVGSSGRLGSASSSAQQQLNDLLMAAAARLSQRKKARTKRQFGGDGASTEFAHLVLSDGCRNPAYRAIAPNHPEADSTNGLEVGFHFRAFMFRSMQEGEAVRITARITACVEQTDCQLMQCPDDGGQGFGRKRRHTTTTTNTTDFDRNLTFVIWTSGGQDGSWSGLRNEKIREPPQRACAIILIAAAGITVFLSSTAAITAIVAILRRRRNSQCSSCRTKLSFGSSLRLCGPSKITPSAKSTSRAVLNNISPVFVPSECPGYESVIGDNDVAHGSGTNSFESNSVQPIHLSNIVSRTSQWPSVQDLLKLGNSSSSQKPNRNTQMLAGTTWYDNDRHSYRDNTSSIDRSQRSSETLNRADSFLKTFQAFLATSFLNSLRQSFRGHFQTVNLNPNAESMNGDRLDVVEDDQKHVNIVRVPSPNEKQLLSPFNSATKKNEKIILNPKQFINLEATTV